MWEGIVVHPEDGCYPVEVEADTMLNAVLKLMVYLKPGEQLQDLARRGTCESGAADLPASQLFAKLGLP